MSEKIIMYGTTWCGDCHRSRRLLDGLDVAYTWIDLDKNAEAAEYIKQFGNGRRIVPTIIFPDGDVLVEPSDPELSAKIKARD